MSAASSAIVSSSETGHSNPPTPSTSSKSTWPTHWSQPVRSSAGNQLIWEKTAETLRAKGFAVVTVDLRKHGKSLPEGDVASTRLNRTDYQLMVAEDLELVKRFLMDEHHAHKLNIRKLGIVAMGMSAPVALTFAGNDWLKRRSAPESTDTCRSMARLLTCAVCVVFCHQEPVGVRSESRTLLGYQDENDMRHTRHRVGH